MPLALSLHTALSGIPAAILQGALVILPRSTSLPRLTRLRSPLWAAALPGSIIAGTFGVIAMPASASPTLMVAAVTTPLLALVAVVAVVRRRWLVAPAAAIAGLLAVLAQGPAQELSASVVTALACLTVGAGLRRLIPGRWLLAGVLAMAATDVALLASGFGYHETALLAAAAGAFHGPQFAGARVGGTTIGYPDLFLAALLGASLAGRRAQRIGAVMLGLLVVAYDSLLTPGLLLPGTVPIALTLIGVLALRRERPPAPADPRGRCRSRGAGCPAAPRAGWVGSPPPCQRKPTAISRCSSGYCRRPGGTSSTSGAAAVPSRASSQPEGPG